MTRRLSLAALLVFCLAAVPAGAKVVKYKRFVSPSGMISCLAVKYGGKGVECSASYIEEIGELDTYYALEPHGRSRIGERGDFPGYPNSKQHTLHYGDTYKRKGVRCTMRESGLTCRNKDGHGFHLEKGNVRRF
ncbi:MAG: hypothetical protein QOI80_439 [Solirubrobacteraceae bacterium]|jgi:hypothetical protein|nr:hypothetical protein [Solirubrobacteraceae bacterium]